MIKPVLDRIVCEIRMESKTEGGIFIPEAAKDKTEVPEGFVVAWGSDVKVDLKVGDKILFERRCGVFTNYEGKEYLILRERELIAVIS